MPKKSQTISLFITLAAAVIAFFFKKSVSFGLMLGYFFSTIHLQLLTHSIRQMTESKKPRFSIVANLLRLAILALPLLLAALYRQQISIVATVIGVMISKICLFIDGFKK